MTEPETVVFVSFIMLVVTNTSQQVEGTNLRRAAKQRGDWPLNIPNLGRFSIIHWLNYTLMMTAYYAVMVDFIGSYDALGWLILTMILFIFLSLPFIEMGAYDEMILGNKFPISLIIHVSLVFVGMIAVPGLMLIVAYLDSPILTLIVLGLFFLVYLAGAPLFLGQLKRELGNTERV